MNEVSRVPPPSQQEMRIAPLPPPLQVRERLVATRRYYEEMLDGREPSVPLSETYRDRAEMERPLRTIYW